MQNSRAPAACNNVREYAEWGVRWARSTGRGAVSRLMPAPLSFPKTKNVSTIVRKMRLRVVSGP